MKIFLAFIASLFLSTPALSCSFPLDYKSPYKDGAVLGDVSVFRAIVAGYEITSDDNLACVKFDYNITEYIAGKKILHVSADWCWELEKGENAEAQFFGDIETNEMMGFKKGADVLVGLTLRDIFVESARPKGFTEYVVHTPTCYPLHMNLALLPKKEGTSDAQTIDGLIKSYKSFYSDDPNAQLVK